jgi:Zn-dependent metalloprotease
MAAWSQSADQLAVREIFGSITGPNTVESPRQSTAPGGYITYLGAPEGNAFETGPSVKSAPSIDAAAKSFILDHAGAFLSPNPKVGFDTDRIRTGNGRTYVRLQQTYEGLPVFGSGVTVQLNGEGNVECVLSDVMRHSKRLYSGNLSPIPSISPAEAKVAAIAFLQLDYPTLNFSATEPTLEIYEPSVIGDVGTTKLVWNLVVESAYATLGEEPVKEKILVDAHGGGVALHYSLIHNAKDRQIFDSENTPADFGTLKRTEGQGPSGVEDVDFAYDYYGDTYDFYFFVHGRDSINDNGSTLSATVRFCPSLSPFDCPFRNAFWDGSRMYFGEGYVADDVVAHELTHGVTQFESNLIYAFESGAINESFSDIWGEFIDQINGAGTDTDDVKWLVGEDVPDLPFGAFRNMQHPPAIPGVADLPMPDRYLGPGWYFGNSDNGGVHHNSGVCNKLSFLLTDGQKFNNFLVEPMGIVTVADLFYECQVNLLNPGSDYPTLGDALIQAGFNLGYNLDALNNILTALYATKIFNEEGPFLRYFRATGMSGSGNVALTWQNPEGPTAFTGVDLVRRFDRFPDREVVNDGTLVQSFIGGEESYVDGPFAPGTEVFYGLYPRAGSFGSNVPLIARVVVGQDVDYSSESFASGTDLSGHQITFVPVVNFQDAMDSGNPEFYVNHSNYVATVSNGFGGAKAAPAFDGTLPVPKEDIITIPLSDEGTIEFSPRVPFPFFGEFYNTLYLSANGFFSPVAPDIYGDPMDAVPSLENHFGKRRISFLFSDLDPGSGGLVWARFLADRTVITFEDVPAFLDVNVPGASVANTVQVELFHNGEIRCTYLGLTAKRAVVGLSDGNGVPLDPADIIGNTLPADVLETDFTNLTAPVDLELLPIPIIFASMGDTVEFTAEALSNIGAPAYSLEGAPAGATINSTTGQFSWNSSGFLEDIYSFVICATAGGVDACQLVNIFLSESSEKPVASDVLVTPAQPRLSEALHLTYNYSHPTLPEGPTAILWFRDGAMVPAFNNLSMVPPAATAVGQTWYCVVMPTTIQAGFDYYGTPIFLRGDPVQSNIVTIQPDLKTDANKDGKVNSADLQVVVGTILGMQPEETDGDVNSDGNTDVSDVQVIVNTILGGE